MSYSSRHTRSLEYKYSYASGVQALRARRAARQKKQQSRHSMSPVSPSKTSAAKTSAMHGGSMRTMYPLQSSASPSVKRISVDQVDLNGAGFGSSKQNSDSQSGIKASDRARAMLGLGSEPAGAESSVPPELPKASPPLAARAQQQRDEHYVDLPQQPPGGRTSVASTALPSSGQPSPSPSMQYKDGSPPSRASSITGAHFESASQASPRTMLGAGSRESAAGRGTAGTGAPRSHGHYRPDAGGSRSSGLAGAGARGGWAAEAPSRGSMHTAITQSAFDVPPMMPPRTPPAGGGVPPAARGLPPASPAGKRSPRLRDENLNEVRSGGLGGAGPGGLPAVYSWHAGTGAKKDPAQSGGPTVYYIPEGGGDQGALHASASASAEVQWSQGGDLEGHHSEGTEAAAAVQYDARARNGPLGMDDSFDSEQGIERQPQDREHEDQPSTSGHDSGAIPMQPVLHRVPTADREAVRGEEQQEAQGRHAGGSSIALGSPGVGRESPVQTSPQRGPTGPGFGTGGPNRVGKQRAVNRGAANKKPAGRRPGGNGSSSSIPGPGPVPPAQAAPLSREEAVRRAREAKQRQREQEDPLAFGRRARPVGYRPKTLGEYRDRYQEEREAAVRQPAGAFSRKGLQARREPGGLGPDLDSEQVRAARAKAQRAAEFAERARQRNKAALGRGGGRQGGAPSPLERAGARPRGAAKASHNHRPTPQEEEAARRAEARAVPSKRQRALEFAARVREQKMGVDPNARQAAPPSPGERGGGRARGGHETRGMSALARAGRSVGGVARPVRGTKRVGGARRKAGGGTRGGAGAGDAGGHGMSELERLELQHDRLKNKMGR